MIEKKKKKRKKKKRRQGEQLSIYRGGSGNPRYSNEREHYLLSLAGRADGDDGGVTPLTP
jgi:hypothetical protein